MLSTLCQRCGLCCGGSLFTFLPVTQDEAERMRLFAARFDERRDGRTAMLLPCAALRGTCCSAYDVRPARCREYVCKLGRAVQRGERPLNDALVVVDEAKARLDELERRLGPRAPDDSRGVLQRALHAEATEPDDARFRELRVMARAIEELLRRFFVDP